MLCVFVILMCCVCLSCAVWVQPNAETDLYDLLDDVAQRVNSAILASTLVVTVPFGLAGADHYTIRRQLQVLESSQPTDQNSRELSAHRSQL